MRDSAGWEHQHTPSTPDMLGCAGLSLAENPLQVRT